MKTLFELIKEMPEKDWNYYFEINQNNSLKKPFVDDVDSHEFIRSYFKKGGKDLVADDFCIDELSQGRADHTVSLFFFGLLVYKNSSLKTKISFPEDDRMLYDFFQFIWFITCLSHDAAFDLENNESLIEACPTLNDLKINHDIFYDLTKLNGIQNVPTDMFKLCDQYFSYRRGNSSPRVDHGIHAGILMYDRLVKNRTQKFNEGNQDLFWKPILDAQYAYASATVAVHNMWVANDLTQQAYRASGLGALVNRKLIRPSEAPLLYLLDFVDTIEPVKIFSQHKGTSHLTPEEILKNTMIHFANDTIVLKLSELLPIDVMEKKVRGLADWLVSSYSLDGCTISISIPNT